MFQIISRLRPAGFAACIALLSLPATAQYAERGDAPGTGSKAVDVSGRSIKSKRVRAIHTTDPNDLGGTAYFIQRDPFLAYQLGRNLNYREFRTRDGVLSKLISSFGGLMPDQVAAKITSNNQTSCLGCHNLPNGNPGGGANFSKDSGLGRNSPHYFGAGVVEMLALQVRTDLLAIVDTNGDGWVSVAESQAAPNPLQLKPTPNADRIDYGSAALTGGTTGIPKLNNIFRSWYVDQNGVEVPWAFQVDGVSTFGYNFEMIVWGWGQGRGRTALNPTNRTFLWDPWSAHTGLESHDPSTLDDPDGDGISVPTLSGAIQFPTSHRAPDQGIQTHPLGFSVDDPDDDGYLTEISEGDLDLGEWFMLNAPRPAFRGTKQQYNEGVAAMNAMQCNDCHVPTWRISPQDATHDGDRRLFDLDVTFNQNQNRLQGKLVELYTETGGTFTPNRRGFRVKGFFSDLKHHEMGRAFQEIGFDGTTNSIWRTPPLWGVGSGFPWGHDGQSLTLEDVILRHGGHAAQSRNRFANASEAERETVLRFLRRLQLFDIESLPSDIDGDGQVSSNFMVAGRDTGMERFNAEWLFKTPVRIQGPFLNTYSKVITSFCAENTDDAYGQDLPFRKDSDNDGWPDVWDQAPNQTGYKDGVNN